MLRHNFKTNIDKDEFMPMVYGEIAKSMLKQSPGLFELFKTQVSIISQDPQVIMNASMNAVNFEHIIGPIHYSENSRPDIAEIIKDKLDRIDSLAHDIYMQCYQMMPFIFDNISHAEIIMDLSDFVNNINIESCGEYEIGYIGEANT